ncbi:HEAT repeat domain-containing protein [Rhizobium leguminosarum]|uniref:HEAT repeat domain-containing protein n=1 Tax=Rhizobium leguminosarum TaxID=384 RepID=UPI003ECC6D92
MEIKDYRQQQLEMVAKVREAGDTRTGLGDIPGKGQGRSDTRVDAIKRLDLNSSNLAERIPFLLDLLGSNSETVAVRSAALDMLTTAEFIGRVFSDFRPQVIEAMRKLTGDKSPVLRQKALEYLAQESDDFARDILTEALHNPENAPVSQAKVVQLLGLDDHANAADLVRNQFDQLSAPAREEAVRILGTDPKSAALLSRLVNDKSVDEKLRRITAAGLKAVDTERFAQTARKVLADSSDSAALKTALVGMAHTLGAAHNLDGAIETAQNTTKSRTLKKAARRYFATPRQSE